MSTISPYLTASEAAEVLRFTGKHAADTFARYARRKGLTLFKRGKSLLVLKSDVVRSLEAPRRKPRQTTPVTFAR